MSRGIKCPNFHFKKFAGSRRIQLSSFEFSADQIEAVKRLIGRSIAEVECELIIQTLADQRGSRSTAAKLLGISIRTLRNKIHGYAGRGKALPNRASME
jgi:DNA-binding NtrC family response regulator